MDSIRPENYQVFREEITSIFLNLFHKIERKKVYQTHFMPLKVNTRMSTFLVLLNIVLEFLNRAMRKKKEIKGIQIKKKDIKLSIFVDDRILYLKASFKNSYM
jgi:hypothetical protein